MRVVKVFMTLNANFHDVEKY